MSGSWTATLACPHPSGRVALSRADDQAPGAAEVRLALDLLAREHARRARTEKCPAECRLVDPARAAWGEFACELSDLERRLKDLALQLDCLDDACDPKARIEGRELHEEWVAVGRRLAETRAERGN